MRSEVKSWFSAGDLALLGAQFVAGIPTTMRGAGQMAQRLAWVSREVKGKGGKGGIRTEYQPPAEVLALIHGFLKDNPDFFGMDKRRAGRPPAPQPGAAPAPAQVHHQVNENPAAPYHQPAAAPATPQPDRAEEWMAIALNVTEHAIAMDEERNVTTRDKVRIVNRLIGLIDYVSKASGDIELSELDLIGVLKPWAATLVDNQPRKSNSNDTDYQMVKQRLLLEKKKTH